MKAITFEDVRKVCLTDVPEPDLESSDDIIVKVERAAICGSDLHVYHGRETGIDIGTIMGHEFTGTVAGVGADIQKFKVGDRVVSPFTTNCGSCFYCKLGLTARCEKGSLFGWLSDGRGLQGVHTEFVRVPMGDSTLTHLPDDLSWEEGNLLADICCTGYYCAEMAEVKPEGVYVVAGCGPVGQMAIKAAIYLGAETVYAIDSIPFRLEMAERNGAIPLNFEKVDVPDEIRKVTNGRGADAVLEAVGGFEPMKTAFRLLRPGGILASAGVQAYDRFPFSPPDIYDKNLILKAGRCSVRHYLDKLIPIVQIGDLQITDVITHTVDLKDGVDGYRMFDEKKNSTMKVLLKP